MYNAVQNYGSVIAILISSSSQNCVIQFFSISVTDHYHLKRVFATTCDVVDYHIMVWT